MSLKSAGWVFPGRVARRRTVDALRVHTRRDPFDACRWEQAAGIKSRPSGDACVWSPHFPG